MRYAAQCTLALRFFNAFLSTSGTDLSRTDRGGGRNLPSRVTDLSADSGAYGRTATLDGYGD